MPKSLINRLNKVEDVMSRASYNYLDEKFEDMLAKGDEFVERYIERWLELAEIILEDKSLNGKTRQKFQQIHDSLKKEQANV